MTAGPTNRGAGDWYGRVFPSRFRIVLEARETVRLPGHLGGMLRGAFGNALKRAVCAHRPVCQGCRAPLTCPYSYLFETPPPPDSSRLRRYPFAPHPFVIEPPDEAPRELQSGEKLSLDLLLIGRAVNLLAYFVYAFVGVAEAGLGSGRGRLELVRVAELNDDGHTNEIYARAARTISPPKSHGPRAPRAWTEERITLRFTTPTRIVHGGRLLSTPEPGALVRCLLRRVSSLHYFHCVPEDLPLDFRALVARGHALRVAARSTRWRSWDRWSHRQGRHVEMSGFMGDLTLEGDLGPVGPLLELGEALHVGKATVFGLGRYRLVSAQTA